MATELLELCLILGGFGNDGMIPTSAGWRSFTAHRIDCILLAISLIQFFLELESVACGYPSATTSEYVLKPSSETHPKTNAIESMRIET